MLVFILLVWKKKKHWRRLLCWRAEKYLWGCYNLWLLVCYNVWLCYRMQSILDRRLSEKELIGGFPFAAAPVVYSPPLFRDVAEKVGDVGERGELDRRTLMIQRKGYTSDEDLDELDSPLAAIMDKTPPVSPSPTVDGGKKERSQANSRYRLLQEGWCKWKPNWALMTLPPWKPHKAQNLVVLLHRHFTLKYILYAAVSCHIGFDLWKLWWDITGFHSVLCIVYTVILSPEKSCSAVFKECPTIDLASSISWITTTAANQFDSSPIPSFIRQGRLCLWRLKACCYNILLKFVFSESLAGFHWGFMKLIYFHCTFQMTHLMTEEDEEGESQVEAIITANYVED